MLGFIPEPKSYSSGTVVIWALLGMLIGFIAGFWIMAHFCSGLLVEQRGYLTNVADRMVISCPLEE